MSRGPQPKRFVQAIEMAYEKQTDNCYSLDEKQTSYRMVVYKNKNMVAHRVVCRLAHGEPPPDKPQATHSCHNKWCINPRHLRWGSAKDNAADYQQLRRTHGGR